MGILSDWLRNFLRRHSYSPGNSKEAEELVRDLQKQLTACRAGGQSQEPWLHIVYQHYAERFQKDNEKIWTIGAIFIPLSLAGLTVLKDVSFAQTVLLAVGSTMLMQFWVWIAENHRGFQNKSQAIVQAIEQNFGLKFSEVEGKKIQEKLDSHDSVRGFSVQASRWRMLSAVRAVWLGAVLLAGLRPTYRLLRVLFPADSLESFLRNLVKGLVFFF